MKKLLLFLLPMLLVSCISNVKSKVKLRNNSVVYTDKAFNVGDRVYVSQNDFGFQGALVSLQKPDSDYEVGTVIK